MLVRNLLAGSIVAFAAGQVAAVPSDLADLNNDAGSALFPDVPENTYYETGAGYATLTDTSGELDDSNATLLAEAGPKRFFSGWAWRTGRMIFQCFLFDACKQHLSPLFFPHHFQD